MKTLIRSVAGALVLTTVVVFTPGCTPGAGMEGLLTTLLGPVLQIIKTSIEVSTTKISQTPVIVSDPVQQPVQPPVRVPIPAIGPVGPVGPVPVFDPGDPAANPVLVNPPPGDPTTITSNTGAAVKLDMATKRVEAAFRFAAELQDQ